MLVVTVSSSLSIAYMRCQFGRPVGLLRQPSPPRGLGVVVVVRGGHRVSFFDERELCRRRLLMPLIRHAGED